MEQALIDILQQLNGAAGAATDFLLAEIPDVIRQLLLWHGVLNFSRMLGFFFLGGLLIWADIALFRAARKHWDAATTMGVWGALGSIPRIAAWLAIFPLFNITWLQVWLAPKVWLVEYATRLVK